MANSQNGTLDETSTPKMVNQSKMKNLEEVYVPRGDIKDNKNGWTRPRDQDYGKVF